MKNWPLLPLLLITLILPTGCASINETATLSPGTIRTSFDTVRVHISNGPTKQLVVSVFVFQKSLQNLQVVRASTSTWTTEKNLTLQQAVFSPDNPHEMDLIFTPAPQPPFSINLLTKLNGQPLTLRADYYGPHAITF